MSSLDRASASNSSRNKTHGCFRAKSKSLRRFEPVSPKYDEINLSILTTNSGSPSSAAKISARRSLAAARRSAEQQLGPHRQSMPPDLVGVPELSNQPRDTSGDVGGAKNNVALCALQVRCDQQSRLRHREMAAAVQRAFGRAFGRVDAPSSVLRKERASTRLFFFSSSRIILLDNSAELVVAAVAGQQFLHQFAACHRFKSQLF